MPSDEYRCILCRKTYSAEEVKKLLFFPDTSICHNCYLEGQAKPHAGVDGWCFGKSNLVISGKVVQWGYDPKALDCSSSCPDRRWCPLYVTGDINQRQQEALGESKVEGLESTEGVESMAKKKKATKSKAKVVEAVDGNPYSGRARTDSMARIFTALVTAPGDVAKLAEREGLNPGSTRMRLVDDGHGRGPKYITQRWDLVADDSGKVQIVLK